MSFMIAMREALEWSLSEHNSLIRYFQVCWVKQSAKLPEDDENQEG